MNGGTKRGGAEGFALETLSKLKAVKTIDNKRTLLQFIAETLRVQVPDALLFSQDLQVVKPAKSEPMTMLLSEMQQIMKCKGAYNIDREQTRNRHCNPTTQHPTTTQHTLRQMLTLYNKHHPLTPSNCMYIVCK